MNTSAIVMMTITVTLITTITTFFLIKVLRTKPKDDNNEIKEEEDFRTK